LVKQQTHPQFEFYIMVASFFDVIVHLFGFFTTNNQLNKTKTKTKNENQKTKKQNTKHKKQKTKNKNKNKQNKTKLTLFLLSFFQEKELCLVFLFRPDYVLNQDPHVI